MKRTIITLVTGIAIGAAAVAVPVYLKHDRNSGKDSTGPGTVLVAKRLILKGTPWSSIAARNLFLVTTIPKGQIAPGAISDPAVLQGRVAAGDIYQNQQLETSDFTTPH
jgi:flagella basal body P-ring formation protein FlgA